MQQKSIQRRPAFAMPHGACDCHVHLFGPREKFPLASDRLYTPGPATLADLLEHQSLLGLERAVVVHATPQGSDNAYLLHALNEAPHRLRGVASSGTASRSELLAMRRAGVRGIRLNLETEGTRDAGVAIERLGLAAREAADAGLHLQLHVSARLLASIAAELVRLPCIVAIDHFGRIDLAEGLDGPNMTALLRLLRSGRIYLKLSAFHRTARDRDYEDLGAVVKTLVETQADRLLWGSDWPHTQRPKEGKPATDEIDHFRLEDDGRCLELLSRWVGDEQLLHQMLVMNPQELFEF